MESKNGIGLTTIIFLIFLTLKLTNNINWSWWWVTSPIWIPFSIFIVLFLSAFLFFLTWAIILVFMGKDPNVIKDKFDNFKNKKSL
jgi:uncharacterized membrane protein YdjX (TVP38/TMEM64 family)